MVLVVTTALVDKEWHSRRAFKYSRFLLWYELASPERMQDATPHS